MIPNPDPHVPDVIDYLKTHTPCIVAVRTLSAMYDIEDHLKSQGTTYASAKISGGGTAMRKALRDFIEGKVDVLLTTMALIKGGGFKINRDDCFVAATCDLDPACVEQLKGRLAFSASKVNASEHFIRTRK